MAWWGWVLVGWTVAAVLAGLLLGAAAKLIARREAAAHAAADAPRIGHGEPEVDGAPSDVPTPGSHRAPRAVPTRR